MHMFMSKSVCVNAWQGEVKWQTEKWELWANPHCHSAFSLYNKCKPWMIKKETVSCTTVESVRITSNGRSGHKKSSFLMWGILELPFLLRISGMTAGWHALTPDRRKGYHIGWSRRRDTYCIFATGGLFVHAFKRSVTEGFCGEAQSTDIHLYFHISFTLVC